MRIGILQCGHFPSAPGFRDRTYPELYEAMLERHGFDFESWSVVDMAFPESVHDADGWLITGSKHGAYEELPFIPPLEDFIRAAYRAEVPLVGICFGHQIMAQALGGRVAKFGGGWSLGRQNYQFGEETFALNAWHQDQVVTPPPGSRTIGSSDFCAYAGLAYPGRAFSVQPHPEFSGEEISLLLDVRRAALSPEQAERVRATLEQPISNNRMADRIAVFFKESVHV